MKTDFAAKLNLGLYFAKIFLDTRNSVLGVDVRQRIDARNLKNLKKMDQPQVDSHLSKFQAPHVKAMFLAALLEKISSSTSERKLLAFGNPGQVAKTIVELKALTQADINKLCQEHRKTTDIVEGDEGADEWNRIVRKALSHGLGLKYPF